MPWLIFFPYLASERARSSHAIAWLILFPLYLALYQTSAVYLQGEREPLAPHRKKSGVLGPSLPHDVRLSPRHSFGLCGTERGRDHDAFPGFVLVPGAHRRIALCGGSGFLGVVWVCGAWGRCGVCSGIHVRVLLMGEGFNISPP